jgi:polyisoprenoid-binding protein YceI
MKKNTLMLALVILAGSAFAQKKKTTSASIGFDATTKIDELPKADNKTAIAVLDTKTGTVAFEAQVKSFSFSNPMIQEHFNSPKWLDSEKYPTTSFKGKIINLADVKFDTDGTYKATVEGELTVHGITKPVSAPASITVNGGIVTGVSAFSIKLDDYGVIVGGSGKISNDAKITVSAEFK